MYKLCTIYDFHILNLPNLDETQIQTKKIKTRNIVGGRVG